MTEYTSHLSPG